MAEEAKAKGTEAFQAGRFAEAIEHYTKAIDLGATHVLYSNRSAAYGGIGKWEEALKDATKCVEMQPDWGKGYGRKGAALHGLGQYDAAIAAYEKGLTVEPGLAMLTKGLADAKKEAERDKGAGGLGGLANIFGAPDVISKIASNPQTASFLADPSFMMKIQQIQRNPDSISMHMNDPRILQVMGVLMGVNIMTPDSMGDGFGASSSAAPTPPPSRKAPAPAPEPEPEVELTEEEKATKAKKAAAEAHKLKGNDAYKAKKFEEAITHYEAAIAELPEEMTYYNNLSAVRFEQKLYDECITQCKKAIEVGRSARADYKIVAKAFARMGNAYEKLQKLPEAVKAFEDSLMEDRTDEIEKKLKALQKKLKELETHAYINPELAEAARAEGNELFKAGKFPEAIAKYTEAMKRNPKDHVPYSNRAACYQKLMEWQLALKDAETSISMEPTFVKGWSRKAGVHFFLKEYHKAMDAYNMILKLEPDNAAAKAGLDNVVATINMQASSGEVDKERQARAMADPEIQAILGDAQMRSILGEMQTDPKKAQAAMQDPVISAKLQKLIAAGVLQVR
ncbi:stress-induced protein sti1-like protein [Chrysochromulina tobinii]|uniref:Stress-induced protein sti1-like protein n=1 Tax=Chrysochromulina tobinii TaxID=1460289 RepID=A0A0M0JPU5_9EUKA|nr:stress-induced protein sti1-like protein [Chrysochromulina tobinii]|eukprot:KOO28322.1 stress-induced protein sti1-like protein [Chrysochromulina sp. CCMP291]